MRGNEFMELRAFELVARKLSFSRAGEEIGMSRATLSQIVKNLEKRLGVRLLTRTTRSVVLTDAGQELLERLRPALTELVSAGLKIEKFRDSPSGRIRLLSSPLAAYLYIKPLMLNFSVRFPDIVLDMTIENCERRFDSRGFDAAIRPEGHIDLDMLAIKLGNTRELVLVASPSYIQQEGMPDDIASLASHRCIGVRSASTGNSFGWRLLGSGCAGEVDIAAPFVVNDYRFALEATVAGLGVALLPDRLVSPEISTGALERILPSFSSKIPNHFLCYPKQSFTTIAFRSFLKTIEEVGAVKRMTGTESSC